MSELMLEVVHSLDGMSEDSIRFILEMIQRMKHPIITKEETPKSKKAPRPLGMFQGQNFMDNDYDFDEDNEQIAQMFGVDE